MMLELHKYNICFSLLIVDQNNENAGKENSEHYEQLTIVQHLPKEEL